MKGEGKIIKVSGPLVVASGMFEAKMFDVVRVSEKRLLGEIIELREDKASIQVYEETTGVGPGEPVYWMGEPLSLELGPGLMSSIYDGIQRPLTKIMEQEGAMITRGIDIPGLDREKEWDFSPLIKEGDEVVPGQIIAEVQETSVIKHKIMIPPDVQGSVIKVMPGKKTVTDTVVVVRDKDGKEQELTMMQRWPVRRARPIAQRLGPNEVLTTGQRVIDTMFPVAKGGTACIPGPFGSGKTVVQHQIAKWSDADIVVYVGCGERGNEMTDVLMEFPHLTDPITGEPLIKRTVMIANTSNMPVAAREASIYTGITVAEYYRDMGYSVAMMADSTSRWAEALREISGRLEEMPGEEGYPAYLGYRVAEFYERAGRVKCLGKDDREGALSVIGAVSPPGGDLADPMVQATLRVVKVFWGLEDKLAYKRHFPAINWLISYSQYVHSLASYLKEKVSEEFPRLRDEALAILQEEAELEEIARLIGVDSLSEMDRLTLNTARCIREDFLHQNAFVDTDTYTSLKKQYQMLRVILMLHDKTKQLVEKDGSLADVAALGFASQVGQLKHIPEEDEGAFQALEQEIEKKFEQLIAKAEGQEVNIVRSS